MRNLHALGMQTGIRSLQKSLVERPLPESRQERSLRDFLETHSSEIHPHAAATPRGACSATRDGSPPSPTPTQLSRSAKKRAKRRRAIAKQRIAEEVGAAQGVNENPRASAALIQPAVTRPRAKTVQSVEAPKEPEPQSQQLKALRTLIVERQHLHTIENAELLATAQKSQAQELEDMIAHYWSLPKAGLTDDGEICPSIKPSATSVVSSRPGEAVDTDSDDDSWRESTRPDMDMAGHSPEMAHALVTSDFTVRSAFLHDGEVLYEKEYLIQQSVEYGEPDTSGRYAGSLGSDNGPGSGSDNDREDDRVYSDDDREDDRVYSRPGFPSDSQRSDAEQDTLESAAGAFHFNYPWSFTSA